MSRFQLTFNITSDWHIGNGKEAGAYADALVLKDHNQLPYLPGKSIKGLLRQAFTTACENQWFGKHSTSLVKQLFGNEDREGELSQGIIQLSSARLSAQEINYFTATEGATSLLYRVIHATAIDHSSGVAKEGSLRSMEVAVPMVLNAELALNSDHPALITDPEIKANFSTWLSEAVTLINELGAKRHRGLGQVTVTATEIKGA